MTPDLPQGPLPVALTPCPGVLPLTPEREAELRAKLVAETLSWIGTPYRQLGATKGVAIDCSMLLVRVVIEAGIVESFDPRPYPPNWFIHREDERYIDWMEAVAKRVEAPQPGDIIVMKVGRAFAHSGIIISDDELVHAFADERICNRSQRTNPFILYADKAGKRLREHRYFDVFARLRERG
jgi:cell wall-associated NlpC family hydrolase